VARGFTLVEVLVVVVILAIAAGVATVALSTDPRGAAQREARRFAGALEYAAARAQWRNETLGVSVDGHGWRFWRRDDESARWLPLADDDVLVARALEADHTLFPLAYAGAPVAPDALLPLRPSGRNEPYAFVLAGGGTQWIVAADPLNRVAVSTAMSAAGP
jgi:general secretion pathway protein H